LLQAQTLRRDPILVGSACVVGLNYSDSGKALVAGASIGYRCAVRSHRTETLVLTSLARAIRTVSPAVLDPAGNG
jgi:hypothetical protein